MLFNSIEFAIFLPVVFLIYWFVVSRNLKLQNAFLLVASYFFYGWWDWRFLSLLAFSSFVDYFVGLGLSRIQEKKTRRLLLTASIVTNLAFLGFFKYFNFFAESFADAFTLLGTPIEASRLNIILPVGISFYTFQTLSYTIDVYKGKLEPTKSMIDFFVFVSFFPQLVAGPIERATNLLPQVTQPRKFDYDKAMDGARQILWGLFKKIVIADNCARHVNIIFGNYESYSGSTLVLGVIFFAFQIYGDFSGYSDIAIGTSRLLGFNLMRNFAFPYFSRDIAEFWRRWHISLSTWFRDYVYIPLGGSRGNMAMKVRNTLIVFMVSGFWHGANWTFIVWGAINALLFLPLILTNRNRIYLETPAQGRLFPSPREAVNIAFTFGMTLFAWIFFRAPTLGDAFGYIQGIFSRSILSVPWFPGIRESLVPLVMIVLFVIIEWLGRDREYAIQDFGKSSRPVVRWALAYILSMVIFLYGGQQQDFIYFQF
jgi:D-alanyl-lipoteichoic acid acyltransferase DltB (MBOAT superfamily)